MKLEINYRKKAGKNPKYVKIKQHTTEQLLDSLKKTKEELKKIPEDKLKWDKNMRYSKSGTKKV